MARTVSGDGPKRSRFESFVAFRHPNFRMLWIGNLVSNTGDWMDQIALN